MEPGPDRPPTRRRREFGRRVVGVVAGVVIAAYGAGAAMSVAVSDEDTVAGKGGDALAAVSVLKDRYEAAKYVAEHRQEIQAALDYVDENTPPQDELEAAAATSSQTLSKISTTFKEVGKARDAVGDIRCCDPRKVPGQLARASGHAKKAFDERPSAESLRELSDRAKQAAPLVEQVRVLSGDYLEDVLYAADNFSSDELPGTLGVMAAALGLTFVLAQAVGFWARRGRPGLLARTLQGWGARRFRDWYVDTPEALSRPVYAAARERLQRAIVADRRKRLTRTSSGTWSCGSRAGRTPVPEQSTHCRQSDRQRCRPTATGQAAWTGARRSAAC